MKKTELNRDGSTICGCQRFASGPLALTKSVLNKRDCRRSSTPSQVLVIT